MHNSLLPSIVFLHIPKTAGSTFHFILKQIAKIKKNNVNVIRAGKKEILSNFTFKDFITTRDIKIYTGHYVFSDECKKGECLYFS